MFKGYADSFITDDELDFMLDITLDELGYSVVLHDESYFNILDYSKEQDEDGKYYGIAYRNGELYKTRQDVTDEDKAKVVAIVRGEF